MKTISNILARGINELSSAGVSEAAASAEFLMAYLAGRPRTWLNFNGEVALSDAEIERYFELIDKRKNNIPLAYITGAQDFCGHTFIVDEDVLIPRPETEELVEKTIKRLKNPRRILDMCTGSGCIACALAFKYRGAEVIGADNSVAALLTAQKNVDKFKLPVRLIHGDLFENIYDTFDLIISNPPYIPSGEIASLSHEVQSEPRAALDGGENGLEIITQIILYAPDFLNPGGLLALEYGINQEKEIEKIFDKNVWNVIIEKDFNNINRFIFAVKKD